MNISATEPGLVRVGALIELTALQAPAFRDTVKGAMSQDRSRVEVDLSETRMLDSAGLGALVSVHKAARANGGQVILVNPSGICRQLLDLTRLNRTFEIVTRN